MEATPKEWNILIALFKATVEQTTMLTGVPKQRTKVVFGRWIKEGNNLLKLIEEFSDEEYLEEVTEVIENSINELRKIK